MLICWGDVPDVLSLILFVQIVAQTKMAHILQTIISIIYSGKKIFACNWNFTEIYFWQSHEQWICISFKVLHNGLALIRRLLLKPIMIQLSEVYIYMYIYIYVRVCESLRGWFNIKLSYLYKGIPILKMRWWDRLIFLMGICMLVRWRLYVESTYRPQWVNPHKPYQHR